MRYRVVFDVAARDDVDELYAYIREHAGPQTARSYVESIRLFCGKLAHFPKRGTRRDDLRDGLRTIGFQRQATIAFAIMDDEVVILRVLYGGRDILSALGGSDAGGTDSD